MNQKYKLYDTETGEPIPPDLGQCYADDNTVTFGGYIGKLQAEGRLEFRLNDDPEPLTKNQKITALNLEYDPQRTELERYLNLAVNRWGDAEYADQIREELNDLDAEYNSKAEAIWNG